MNDRHPLVDASLYTLIARETLLNDFCSPGNYLSKYIVDHNEYNEYANYKIIKS